VSDIDPHDGTVAHQHQTQQITTTTTTTTTTNNNNKNNNKTAHSNGNPHAPNRALMHLPRRLRADVGVPQLVSVRQQLFTFRERLFLCRQLVAHRAQQHILGAQPLFRRRGAGNTDDEVADQENDGDIHHRIVCMGVPRPRKRHVASQHDTHPEHLAPICHQRRHAQVWNEDGNRQLVGGDTARTGCQA